MGHAAGLEFKAKTDLGTLVPYNSDIMCLNRTIGLENIGKSSFNS